MFNKELQFNIDAKNSLVKGINTLADAVKVTFGPQGNCVIIGDIDKQPRVTKDGVSVAKEIQLENLFENAGAQLIKEAAIKTVNAVGDATTTSTILAQALVNQCFSVTKPVQVKQEINKAVDEVLEYIKSKTIQVTNEDIKNIATISSNNDAELGELIGKAFNTVGKDGIVTVEESANESTRVDVINGMQFERGYIAQHFVTDYVKDVCVLDNPYILITEHKINRLKDLQFVLNQIVSENRSLLIIAEDYDDSVVESLKLNKLNSTLKVCAIKAPSFCEYRNLILNDIAVLTGGTNLSYDSGMELTDLTINMLGTCGKVTVNKDITTLINGKGNKQQLDTHVASIRHALDGLNNDPTKDGSFLINFNKERIAKLTAGIAVIYVGGTTEIERGERKDRVEDAVAATKAAIEEGIVLGGGLTYYNASKHIKDNTEGADIVRKALQEPLKLLVESAGEEFDKTKQFITETFGFDAKNDEIVDMYKAGIIDPAKAVRLALENSVSISNLFLSTQCIIVPKINNQIIM